MTDDEINGEYEVNTGTVIIRAFKGLDSMAVPAVLIANHGPFAWGADPQKAAENAWMLEAVARMAFLTVAVNANAVALGKTLHARHFLRKHGAKAYYGQAKSKK
jgi:L-ribulose-5-phosphate 4-epimerase